jgi:hypothetical protein
VRKGKKYRMIVQIVHGERGMNLTKELNCDTLLDMRNEDDNDTAANTQEKRRHDPKNFPAAPQIKKQNPNTRPSTCSISNRGPVSPPILTNQRLHFNIQKILPRNSITKSHGLEVHCQGGSTLVAPGGKMNRSKLSRSGECLRPGWVWHSISPGDCT